MKLSIFAFIRLRYYTEVFKTMMYLNDHITYKPAEDMHKYWLGEYRLKISLLLEKQNNKMFK